MKREAVGHTKMKRLCRRMDIPLWQGVGLLEALWHLTARECPRGDIGRLSDEDIALGIDYRGDETALVQALIGAGWIDTNPECRLLIHDWSEHADMAVHLGLAKRVLLFADGMPPVIPHNSFDGRTRGRIKADYREKYGITPRETHSQIEDRGAIGDFMGNSGEKSSEPREQQGSEAGKLPTIPEPEPVPEPVPEPDTHEQSAEVEAEVPPQQPRPVVCVSDHPRKTKPPAAADLPPNGAPPSQRFPEFWERYPRQIGRDSAARDWLSVVTVADEDAAFSCLDSYCASDEVARGVVMSAGSTDRGPGWIMRCYRDGWKCRWPKPRAQPAAARKDFVADVTEVFGQRVAKGQDPWT